MKGHSKYKGSLKRKISTFPSLDLDRITTIHYYQWNKERNQRVEWSSRKKKEGEGTSLSHTHGLEMTLVGQEK